MDYLQGILVNYSKEINFTIFGPFYMFLNIS